MADTARQSLDDKIAHATRVESMLRHLAQAIEDRPKRKQDSDVYPHDAIAALEYGAKLARQERSNLEHVRAIYDAKVEGSYR